MGAGAAKPLTDDRIAASFSTRFIGYRLDMSGLMRSVRLALAPPPAVLQASLLLAVLFIGSAHAEDVLHLYNWNNYISDETVARFETQCACRVVQDYYSDNEEMLAKLAAGATGYDLIVPTGNAMESLIRQHALRPLDKSQLPNLRNIDPAYLNTAFDPGNRYSVPYAYTLTLIGYNNEKIKGLGLPVDSWAVIF